jgi:tRNA threonylcarbamoyladenosine biosynthesis protein TsaB
MLLSIDTSTQMIGIGLHDGKEILCEYLWRGMGRHTVELAPQIVLMMRRVELSPEDLETVAVAIGPGSYTGLRIGLALGKGLALSRGLKIIGVPTFDIVAYLQPQSTKPLFVALMAGRKRIVGMWYKWSRKRWQPDGELGVQTWKEFIKQTEEGALICGEIDPAARQLLREHDRFEVGSLARCTRRPGDLAELALQRMRSKRRKKQEAIVPIYSAAP